LACFRLSKVKVLSVFEMKGRSYTRILLLPPGSLDLAG
jgi:hypothetical protein